MQIKWFNPIVKVSTHYSYFLFYSFFFFLFWWWNFMQYFFKIICDNYIYAPSQFTKLQTKSNLFFSQNFLWFQLQFIKNLNTQKSTILETLKVPTKRAPLISSQKINEPNINYRKFHICTLKQEGEREKKKKKETAFKCKGEHTSASEILFSQ